MESCRGVNRWSKLCTLIPTNAQFLGITAKFLKFNNLNFNKFKIIIKINLEEKTW